MNGPRPGAGWRARRTAAVVGALAAFAPVAAACPYCSVSQGAETLVSGSGIFGGDDYGQRISAMRAAAESGLAAR